MTETKSLVHRAEDGDRDAQRRVDMIGCAATLVILACAAAMVYLLVWAVVFTVNGGDWAAS